MSDRSHRPAEDPGPVAGVLGSPAGSPPPADPTGPGEPAAGGHSGSGGVTGPGAVPVARRPDAEHGPTAGEPAAEGPAAEGRATSGTTGLAALDDVDAEVYTIGQAAELLAVPVAALRRLDDAGALRPGRSAGRHRRYSRRQLQLAQRMLTLVAEGTAIAAARRIADLEGEVRDLETEVRGLEGEVRDLREQLDRPTDSPRVQAR
jgi:MerR family transcriptional regulator, heat shock protein HspR